MDSDTGATFLIGEWLVQPRLNRISRPGEIHHLEPKVMDVLILLATNAGVVLSKEQIVEAVWGRSFVAASTVSRAIAQIRHALGDCPVSPRYVETISKRGYRVLCPVRERVESAPRTVLGGFARHVVSWVTHHDGRTHRHPGS